MRFINEIIHKNPVLNSDEVNELCKRIKKGDRAALNKFALSNCGLIVKLLHDMHVEDQDISDMFQECFCEYLEKISRYDPARGAFSTFIYPWLKDTVKKRNTAGIPIKVLTDNASIKRAEEKFIVEFGRYPSASELSKVTGLSEKRINALGKYNEVFYKDSLDRPLETENGGFMASLEDTVSDTTGYGPAESAENMDIVSKLYAYIDYLAPRQKKVITLLFNLDNAYDHPMTLREVEKLTGIGRMTVANDRDAALEKLRYYFERDGYCEDKFAA